MEMLPNTTLRPFVAGDVAAGHALTASFRWPHRIEDWRLMQSLGQGVVAELDGVVAGTALCWRYGDDWATLGMICVAEALQGRGMGRTMMHAVMAGLQARHLALHATLAGVPLYESCGFERTGMVVQHQGIVSAGKAGDGVRPTGPGDLGHAAALDREACGMDRSRLLAALLEEPGGVALARGGAMTGFALVRRFGRGEVVGPVAAANGEDARVLIGHLLGQRAGHFVRVDVPEDSGLGPWLHGQGLPEVDRVIRMVRGGDRVPFGAARTFALASQAFG